MNFKLIQKIINSTNKYNKNFRINSIKTDSRKINPGDIFLCINSGYLYAEEAIKKGAVGIISEVSIDSTVPVLYVENTIKALKSLGSYYRSQYKGKVIAITGSNGKTTTKAILTHLLSKKYKVLCNPNSENNLIGISNTLLKLNSEYDYLVLELGMNHAGEISELSNLIIPDIAVITNIGTSHIGYLGSKDNIYAAKMEIIDGNNNLELFVNHNDDYLARLSCHQVIPNIKYKDINKISLSLSVAILNFLGITYDEKDLDDLKLPVSRFTKYKINGHIIIDDSYNASYDSFLYGLGKLEEYDEPKLIIFGDMLELGKYSDYYHQEVIKEIEKRKFKVITYGEITKKLNSTFHFDDMESLKNFLKAYNWNNEVIYIKASHRLNLALLIPFFEHLW